MAVSPEMEQKLKEAERKKKLAGTVGIAKKAGKAILGTELVTGGIRSGSPKKCAVRVFLAQNAAANTVKRVKNCCDYYEVPYSFLSLTTEELARAVGKEGPLACIGILDAGLSEAILAKNV